MTLTVNNRIIKQELFIYKQTKNKQQPTTLTNKNNYTNEDYKLCNEP